MALRVRYKGDMAAMANPLSGSTALAMQQGSELRGLIDVAMQIAAKRHDILAAMKAALTIGDNNAVIDLAKQLCGIVHEESNRVNSRIN
jgi:hypothetical protein